MVRMPVYPFVEFHKLNDNWDIAPDIRKSAYINKIANKIAIAEQKYVILTKLLVLFFFFFFFFFFLYSSRLSVIKTTHMHVR